MSQDATTAVEKFSSRHIGPSAHEVAKMLAALGVETLEQLIDETIPASIRLGRDLDLPAALTEPEALEALRERAEANEVARSYLGMGYHGTITPPVILRNILENPGWYTAYTPYQAEISQGRLEALLNFQTVVQDLTGMEIANASMLDEATAAAEAMTMSHRIGKGKRNTFCVDADTHPATIAVIETRALPLGIRVLVGDVESFDLDDDVFGLLLSYPGSSGAVRSFDALVEAAHARKVLVTAATDLLALTLLRSPGAFGVDIVVGNSQRFGVPLGYGGPHAAFLATRMQFRRTMPGRIIGASVDADGHPALRMALQTREQHIRRQKATSNICTAQVLLAVIAGAYAVWHGPEGLRRIANRVHALASRLAAGLETTSYSVSSAPFFDTVCVRVGDDQQELMARALAAGINLRAVRSDTIVISLDETVGRNDLEDLLEVFGVERSRASVKASSRLPEAVRRTTDYMTHPAFHAYRSETEMLRYLHRLESRDLALNTAMIPLGSCTMKLNATTQMIPVTFRGFGGVHPFAPRDQATGYRRLFTELEDWLAEITGFDAISLQPNAGSQGEYAGLLVIRAFHEARGESHRSVCLIPTSAHGTNPASAVMAGMRVVAVSCDDDGNIDVDDLRAKAEKHADQLAALMVTYPSTHGVFESAIQEVCEIVHGFGGQVYMDGANMNAMVGLCRPADFGADVCHLNLHKTFSIPHGGGGPGMGPIGVRAHLAPFLPSHPVVDPHEGEDGHLGPVSGAPWGSPSILPISWAYIAMLGAEGMRRSSEVAILNANYIAARLEGHYPVLYRGANGRVAHECILDLRGFKSAGISVEDVAKRLVDYGFHAPTMSWPVVGTLMVEPTESEAGAEIDRFCDAMIAIRAEIREIEEGVADADDNVLVNAPHTARHVTADEWSHPYTRQKAAYPVPGLLAFKYWSPVRRVDNAFGDRNLVCSCYGWEPEEA